MDIFDFSIPSGYSCVVRSNDTTLYGYTGSRRDTYVINGNRWQNTATASQTLPANSVCVSGWQVPSAYLESMVIVGVFFTAILTFLLYRLFSR